MSLHEVYLYPEQHPDAKDFPGNNPALSLVEGTPGSTTGTELFDTYMGLRAEVAEIAKPDDAITRQLQESVRSWIDNEDILPAHPDYSAIDRDVIDSKIGRLIEYLAAHHPAEVSAIELEATRAFVDSAFEMYGERTFNGKRHPDADGSFAFVVPIRMSRKTPGYGGESEPVIPAFRYVPNELRAQFMVGLPPFVIDTYERDRDGKRGYLVFAPVYADMAEDVGNALEAIQTARDQINNSVDFAQERLGVESVGLGAVLPALTHFGKEVQNKNVTVTTGHGGTAYLVKETVREAIRQGFADEDATRSIGVLGLGSIGASIANLIAEEFPDSKINIYDSKEAKVRRTAEALLEHTVEVVRCGDAEELLKSSNIIISAITSRLNLEEMDVDLAGKVIIDDSQPGSVDPLEVESMGGNVLWVVGSDTQDNVVRTGYDYGTLVDPKRDLFGCEGEAAVLALLAKELQGQGIADDERAKILSELAVREPVTPEKAQSIGRLFAKFGVRPAKPQAFGRLVHPNRQQHS